MQDTSDFVQHPAEPSEAGRACAICQTQIAGGEPVGPCPACKALYHRECWTENGGCAIYGCERMPPTVKDGGESAAPQSYWGQQDKTCPKCAEKIRVAAVRCRYCGTNFDSAVPVSRREMREKERTKDRQGQLKTISLWLFIGGIVPCVAPIAAVAGGIWFMGNRQDISKLPSINRVYCYAGLIASIVSTTLIVVATVFVALT